MNCASFRLQILAASLSLSMAATAQSTPAPKPASAATRLDLCSIEPTQTPAQFFPHYNENKYDNSVLNLPGKSMFFDKPSGFRCRDHALADGKDSGMYSTDNILFTTSPDEGSIRMVRVSMGMTPHFEEFSKYLLDTLGPGTVLKSNVKTKGELKSGEEIRVVNSSARVFYIDTVYMVQFQVGAVQILLQSDKEGNQKMVEDLLHPKS